MKSLCVFYKEGYCAAGDRCVYSHAKPTVPCKSFFDPATRGKCKFGSACMFLHRKPEPDLPAPPLVAKPPDWGSGATTQSVGPLLIAGPAVPTDESQVGLGDEEAGAGAGGSGGGFNMGLIDSLWDHAEDGGSDGGVYFYGAAGTSFDGGAQGGAKATRSNGGGSWAAVAKKNAVPSPEGSSAQAAAARAQPAARKRVVCVFFGTGNCRYGARCMNIHSLGGGGGGGGGGDGEDDLDVREVAGAAGEEGGGGGGGGDEVAPADCGICYSNRPEDGVYGILSHCDCIFCLSCIRQWRTQHGKEITSSAGQVRLCPLCRVESHFTVPSVVALRHGDKKDLLIRNYRASLKKIPCKFASQCPFGNSCFYLHPDSDRTTVHHLLNASGEVEVRGEGLDLFSFVKNKLKK